MEFREEWARVPDFPGYLVSSYGSVWNARTDSPQRRSKTLQGDYKVTLVEGEVRATRSVRVLVAESFVLPPYSDDDFEYPPCDRVIVLDNNKDNVMAYNLAWRPAWFALRYAMQFGRVQPDNYMTKRILNTDTETYYTSVLHAGEKEGLLFDDIWMSASTHKPVFPTFYTFDFV